MNKMVGTTFFVTLVVMSVLVGGVYMGLNLHVDPVLEELAKTAANLQPEVQGRLAPFLASLERIRDFARLYVPSVLFLAGLTITLILSPLIRKWAKAASASLPAQPKVRTKIVQEKQKRAEPDSRRLLDMGACRIMAVLQNKGRLIDFLEEDLTGYPDEQVGAAVRHIHEDCRNALREYVTLEPIMPEEEGDPVVVSEGFDSSEIRLTGQVGGKAPFRGTLQHPGWKVTEIKLPDQPRSQKHTVIAPAEIEIGP